MSTYEDNLLAARFAALAPEPLAGNWDEVLDRAGAGRKGRRRPERSRMFQGRRRRRRLVVLAAVALVAVATASAFAVRAFVIDKGIVGLPPVGATPSTPENGVLEMYIWVHPVVLRPLVPGQDIRPSGQSWVYADGRLIRLGGGRVNGRLRRGFIEQRLTREGVKLLRSEIVSTGLFGHERPCMNFIQLLHGEQRVAPPTERQKFCSKDGTPTAATPQQRHALKRLVGRLANPESWLPASAWKQRKFRAYVPSRFEVCAGAVVVPDIDKPRQGRLVQMGPARIVALLPAAAQNVLRARDWRTRALRLTPSARRGIYGGCFAVTTNEARSLAKALDGAGPATARKGGAIRLHYTFDAPGPSRQVWISFDPFLPHGEVTCSQCG
jgi:hypothetical protein